MGNKQSKKLITSKQKLLEEMAARNLTRPDEEMLSRYASSELLFPMPPKGTKPGRWRKKTKSRARKRQHMQYTLDDRTIYL